MSENIKLNKVLPHNPRAHILIRMVVCNSDHEWGYTLLTL